VEGVRGLKGGKGVGVLGIKGETAFAPSKGIIAAQHPGGKMKGCNNYQWKIWRTGEG
jgi:hypothetical protein